MSSPLSAAAASTASSPPEAKHGFQNTQHISFTMVSDVDGQVRYWVAALQHSVSYATKVSSPYRKYSTAERQVSTVVHTAA